MAYHLIQVDGGWKCIDCGDVCMTEMEFEMAGCKCDEEEDEKYE